MPSSLQRRLGHIESELELTTPRLAMMFRIFTRLNAGERPNGAERLPRPGRLSLHGALPFRGRSAPRGRSAAKWPAAGWRAMMQRPQFVVLVMFAAAIASVAVLASQSGPSLRQCPRRAPSARSMTTSPAWYPAPVTPAGQRCPVYITNK